MKYRIIATLALLLALAGAAVLTQDNQTSPGPTPSSGADDSSMKTLQIN